MVRWIKSHASYTEFFKPDYQIRTVHFYVPVLWREGEAAIGITLSRKVGKAVIRNKLKRRIRAWFIYNSAIFPANLRLNLVARLGAGELSWPELCMELDELSKLLRQRKKP